MLTGGCNNYKGHPQSGQGRNQRGHGSQGNGNTGIEVVQTGIEIARQNDSVYFYVFSSRIEAEAFDAIPHAILAGD